MGKAIGHKAESADERGKKHKKAYKNLTPTPTWEVSVKFMEL
jgi:hypothetical protein